jgi:DNA (cytosine-5)-methyltransferase 1
MRSTHPDFENDERHFLYREYLRIIADHRPPVFVMKNVKGMLSAQHSGQKIIGRILSNLRKPDIAVNGQSSGLGYRLFSPADTRPPEECEPEDFLVKAEKYGIPQARHRMLILGIRADIHITPETLQESKVTSVEQAIADLPKIRSTLSKEPDTLERWREILGSVTSETWYRNGRSDGLSQTVEIIDEALVDIYQCKLTTGAESMNYTGHPRIFRDWYRKAALNRFTIYLEKQMPQH